MGARLTNRERGEFIHISVDLSYVVPVKSTVDILQYFVAFFTWTGLDGA